MNFELKKSENSEKTINTALDFSSKIKPPVLIGLSGELGTGKTTFVKGIARGLGVEYPITSPTFLGISEYKTGKILVIHMDFYKKVTPEEIIKSYLEKGSVVIIEWIENYKSVFGKELKPDISVYINYLKDNSGAIIENERQIKIQFNKV